MVIDRVTVRFGELRSTGYPTFSNTRHELELSAVVQAGESAADVRARLSEVCRAEVRRAFGDRVDADPMQTRLTV